MGKGAHFGLSSSSICSTYAWLLEGTCLHANMLKHHQCNEFCLSELRLETTEGRRNGTMEGLLYIFHS